MAMRQSLFILGSLRNLNPPVPSEQPGTTQHPGIFATKTTVWQKRLSGQDDKLFNDNEGEDGHIHDEQKSGKVK
jgi:hypothetical protein